MKLRATQPRSEWTGLNMRRRRSRSTVHDVAGEPDNSRSGLTGSWSGSAATRPVSAIMREQSGLFASILALGFATTVLGARRRRRRLDDRGNPPARRTLPQQGRVCERVVRPPGRCAPGRGQTRTQASLRRRGHQIRRIHSTSTTNEGAQFANNYCWFCRFKDDEIVEVRAYFDSMMVAYRSSATRSQRA